MDSDEWALLLAAGMTVALLHTEPVDAAEFKAPFQGGELRLMSMPCKWSQELQAGYLKPVVGERVWACWVFGQDMVWVRLEGGDTVMHVPWADFSVVVDGSEYKAAAPSRPQFKEGM